MLNKIADFAFTDIHPVNMSDVNTNGFLVRTAAANRIVIEPNTEKSSIIEAEIKKHPNALFFRAKAIEANKPNTNGDYFSEEELLKAYKSFEGVPFFTNHNNQNIENARGKVIFAEWLNEEKACYVLAFVDRDAYPDICRGIEHEYVTGVSMGCSVEYSICNICGNKAEKTDDYCFVPGTPILMDDLSVKNIEDVTVGDVVIDAFGKETKVTKAFIHDIDENILSIKSKKICNELKVTKNHPFLAERRGEFHFIPAEYLDDKETLFTPITKANGENFFDIYKYEDEENKNAICKLLGYFIAEGHLIHNSNGEDIGINISLHSDEKEYLEEIIQISEKIFNKTPEIIDRNNYNHKCKEIRIYNPLLVSMIYDSCDGKANQKILNKKIINLDNKYIKQILAGYIDGDGYSDEYGRLIITTASRNLAYQLIHLLSRIGITASIGSYLQNKGPNNRDELTTIYRVSIGTMQTINLNGCGIKASKSATKGNLKISNGSQTKLKNSFDHDGFIKSSAYGIEELAYQGPVYNIETESHSYVADNISVHNCTHIKNRKGRKFTGKARNIVTGETRDFRDEPVFEFNFGLKFIELSAVVDPACPSCHIQGIIANNDYLAKVASLENDLWMVKTAALEKEASQEEIQQIDGVLQTLETIAVSLIKNRKQIEMEFASELVDILSQLQTWMDELVGAGYGNLPNAEVPGTAGNTPEAAPAAPEAAPAAPAPTGQAGVSPMASEAPIGGPKVSGAPGKPLVQGPKLPITTPVKPRAADTTDSRTIQRIADYACPQKYEPNVETRNLTGIEIIRKASSLCSKLNKSGDIDMGKRRTITAKQQEKDKVMEILSSSWQEKQDFFEYIKQMPSIQDNENRLLINKRDDSFIVVGESKNNPENKIVWTYEDLTDDDKKMIQASPKDASVKFLELFSEKSNKQKEGEKIMTDINKNAGATTVNPVPQEVQEAQLRQKGLYHSRTETEQNQVTQAQLESLRKGEQEVLTQKQLDAVRTNEEAQEVQEAQLKPLREDNEKNTVTQDQLKSQRKDSEPEVITQKQLDNAPAPWARTADRDPALFKSAADHMKSVINVLAETVLSAGCAPDEVCEVASSLVDSTKNRVYLASSILETAEDKESIDFGKRMAFWNNKNLKVASTSKKEIAQLIVDGLRKVASDKTVNPDILIEAVDVIGEGAEGVTSVSKKVDEKLVEASKQTAQVSRKSELRAALKETSKSKDERASERDTILEAATDQDIKMKREAERQAWEKVINKEAAKNATYMIETSFQESSLKKDDPSFKNGIVSFARGALASQNLKFAAVTNVTISGDTIQIAVQTDEGEQDIEIPVGDDSAPSMDETVPEGDMSGEGLEGTLSTPPAAPATTPAPAGVATPMAASKKKMTKVAQAPMGGGAPGAQGGVSAPGASEQGLPGPLPGGDAIQSLTQDTPAEEGAEDVPTVGEQQEPFALCPECGSSDADVSNEDGNIKGKCNKCSAEWEGLIQKNIQFKITKPTVSIGKPAEGGETPEAPAETPEVPSLPVAAQTRIDKGSIVRMAENRKQHGHVCPACGKKQCKASKDGGGHSEYTCPSCKTDVVKDIMISASDPSQSFMRVRWDIRPRTSCKGCGDEVAKFASKIKVSQMLKTAAANKDSFPMANCVERMARQYGGNTVATFGPCKGKLLANCVCKDLQKLGFSKIKDMQRLATAMTQKDPMDECVEDQKKKGHEIKEAKHICNCLKKKFASELADNIYAHAFAKDIIDGKETRISAQDLATLYVLAKEEELDTLKAKEAAIEAANNADIGSDLPPLKEAEVEVEVVKEAAKAAKASKAAKVEALVVKEAKGFFCDKCKKPCKSCDCPKDGGDKDDKDDNEKDEKDEKTDKKEAMAMNGQRVRSVNEEVFNMASIKIASTPTKVEDIEGNVEAGVPRKQAYMGEEARADSMINKTPKKPEVPRSDAYMGKEKEADSMINAELKLPDVAVDSAYMGKEKEVQSGMPAINNEIKGTVIATDTKTTKQAKQMKEVDTVEKDVEAGVPRSDAKMGEESKADSHINAPNKGPDVPRSEAYMGKEKEADSMINEKLKGPDVPIDNAYMGHEKEVQKGMPGINDEILKQVKMQREEQLNKIAVAREKQAMKVASWLVGNGRIPNDLDAFEATVKALSAFEIDKIVTVASMLFPARTVKTSSATQEIKTASDSHAIPAIVMESKNKSTEDNREDLVKKLAGAFTIGNRDFDHKLTIYGEKE